MPPEETLRIERLVCAALALVVQIKSDTERWDAVLQAAGLGK